MKNKTRSVFVALFVFVFLFCGSLFPCCSVYSVVDPLKAEPRITRKDTEKTTEQEDEEEKTGKTRARIKG